MTDPYTPSPTSGASQPPPPAEEIRSAAKDAGSAAAAALADVKENLKDQGGEKVDTATTSAGESLSQAAEQLRQASDNLDGQGWAKQAFSQGADGLERVSGYLKGGSVDDFARDLQGFARNNPAAFLAGSVAIGFIAARIAKTAAEHASQTPSSTSTTGPDAAFAPATEAPFASSPEPGAPYGGTL